jgi:hypothetical protein
MEMQILCLWMDEVLSMRDEGYKQLKSTLETPQRQQSSVGLTRSTEDHIWP